MYETKQHITAKRYAIIKRIFDLALAIALTPFCAGVMIVIAVAVKATSKGPVLHLSKRVGRNKTFFMMAKVRSMKVETPHDLATHLMNNPEAHLTSIGGFLRKTSLDEVPQLWNIIKNDMSFVGPRPALFNQDDLVALRDELQINDLTPGLTGWAQVNGRDELPIPDKVKIEEQYLEKQSFWFDIYILWLTLKKALLSKDVSH